MPSSPAAQLQSPNPSSENGFLSWTRLNGAFKTLILILLTAAQLGAQGGITKPPWETHPAIFYTFLLSTVIHLLAITVDTKSVVGFISGSLSFVSLVSIFVPLWFWYIIFVFWALVSICMAYEAASNKELYNYECVGQKIKDFGRWLKELRDEISSLWSSDNEQGLPQVDPRVVQGGQMAHPPS